MKRPRLLAGFLLAPGLPALAIFCINLAYVGAAGALLGSLLFALPAYLGAVVFGMPVHLILRWCGCKGVGAYLASGACIGLLCYALIRWPWGGAADDDMRWQVWLMRISPEVGLIVLGYALAASWLFWLIAVKPAASARAR